MALAWPWYRGVALALVYALCGTAWAGDGRSRGYSVVDAGKRQLTRTSSANNRIRSGLVEARLEKIKDGGAESIAIGRVDGTTRLLRQAGVKHLVHIADAELVAGILKERTILCRTELAKRGVRLKGKGHFITGMKRTCAFLSVTDLSPFSREGRLVPQKERAKINPHTGLAYETFDPKVKLYFSPEAIDQATFSHISPGWSGGHRWADAQTREGLTVDFVKRLREDNEVVFDRRFEFKLDQVRAVVRSKKVADELVRELRRVDPDKSWEQIVQYRFF